VLTNKAVESLIHRILSGRLIFEYFDRTFELKKPSLDLKIKADLIYQQSYESNLYDNFWLIEDIPNLAIDIGILDISYRDIIKKIEKKIDIQKMDLYKEFSNQNQKKKNKTKIAQSKRNLNEEYNKLHYLDYLSLEHYCDKIKNEFLISNTLYYFDTGDLVFYPGSIDYNMFNSLIVKISEHIITIENYKQIARHEYWKNLWSNNKFNIISEGVNEWSDEQKTLFNIAAMYDRIAEHPECPSQEIIEDDDALDGWMIFQKEKNNKEKRQKGVDNMLSDKIRNSSEIFLVPSNKEEISEIQDLNSFESRQRSVQKFDYIAANKDKNIEEIQLPDVKAKIQQELLDKGRKK
jgi:hypothetical protein